MFKSVSKYPVASKYADTDSRMIDTQLTKMANNLEKMTDERDNRKLLMISDLMGSLFRIFILPEFSYEDQLNQPLGMRLLKLLFIG